MQPSLVVLDLAPDPVIAWAVVFKGRLLPIRFATRDEAWQHLTCMETGQPIRRPEDAAA